MKASDLLDQIIKTMSDLGTNPLVSDTVKAFQKAEALIQGELDKKFQEGRVFQAEKIEKEIQDKLKNQN